jgi:hypothetical protein
MKKGTLPYPQIGLRDISSETLVVKRNRYLKVVFFTEHFLSVFSIFRAPIVSPLAAPKAMPIPPAQSSPQEPTGLS